jgi:hypothetical protein
MIKTKQQKVVKFPENREIANTLEHGDRVIIAEYSGYSASTVRGMLIGKRRLTDRAAKAIIRLKNERSAIQSSLHESNNK